VKGISESRNSTISPRCPRRGTPNSCTNSTCGLGSWADCDWGLRGPTCGEGRPADCPARFQGPVHGLMMRSVTRSILGPASPGGYGRPRARGDRPHDRRLCGRLYDFFTISLRPLSLLPEASPFLHGFQERRTRRRVRDVSGTSEVCPELSVRVLPVGTPDQNALS
jgi:hypothetical protein